VFWAIAVSSPSLCCMSRASARPWLLSMPRGGLQPKEEHDRHAVGPGMGSGGTGAATRRWPLTMTVLRHLIGLASAAALAMAAEKVAAEPAETPICLMIESAAQANGLPVEFFARVIWQESRFDAGAVGPVTRSGERAQDIAQFMPGTAAERRLLDPFDPVEALPKSAEFLKELRAQFGNLGLAAAAYNAGPRRVREWLDGAGGMPQETRSYVAAITGLSVEDWAKLRESKAEEEPPPRGADCGTLMALLKTAPNPFIAGLEQRVARAAVLPWGVQLAAGFSRNRVL